MRLLTQSQAAPPSARLERCSWHVARLLDRHSREIFVTVTVVFFDVGETLVDESRLWEQQLLENGPGAMDAAILDRWSRLFDAFHA